MARALLALAAVLLGGAQGDKLRQPLLARSDSAAVAAADAAVSPVGAQPPPEVAATLQDMSEAAVGTRTRFTEFTDRIASDQDRLRQEFQGQAARIADLELEKTSLQAQMVREKQKLNQELETFKQKMIAKLTEVQTANRRLEETNMQLSNTNDKLSADLEAEKARKQVLMKKLSKMAETFNHQQSTVRQLLEQQQRRAADEVSSDMRDAAEAADDESSVTPAQAPRALAAAMPSSLAEPATAYAPVQPAVMPPPEVAPQPRFVAPPAPVVVQAARPAAPKAAAVAKSRPAKAAPVPEEQAAAHALEDDQQLQMLRNEVAKLEQNVRTEDGAEASTAGH